MTARAGGLITGTDAASSAKTRRVFKRAGFINAVNGATATMTFYKMQTPNGVTWVNQTGDDTARPGGAVGTSIVVAKWFLQGATTS